MKLNCGENKFAFMASIWLSINQFSKKIVFMTIYLKFLLAFLLTYFFSPCSFFTSLLCSIFQDGIKFFRQKSHKGYFISDVGRRQFNLFPQTLEQKSQLGTIQDINIRQTISGELQCRNRRKPSLQVSVIKAEHTPVCLKCSSHSIQPPSLPLCLVFCTYSCCTSSFSFKLCLFFWDWGSEEFCLFIPISPEPMPLIHFYWTELITTLSKLKVVKNKVI